VKELRPTHIHILAKDDESRQRAERLYVHHARVMLGFVAAMTTPPTGGMRKSFADGTLIQVTGHENQPLVATIRVLPLPKPQPKEEEKPDDYNYLWIGIRVCWEDMVGEAFPTAETLGSAGWSLEDLDTVLEAPNGEYCGVLRYGVAQGERYGWNETMAGHPTPLYAVSFSTGTHGAELATEDFPHPHNEVDHYYNIVYSPAGTHQINLPVAMNGTDPVGVADMGAHLADDELADILPLVKQRFLIGETEQNLLYDFWADAGTEAFMVGEPPSGTQEEVIEDLVAAPMVLSRTMYCANAMNNPDCIARHTRVLGWQAWDGDPDIYDNGYGYANADGFSLETWVISGGPFFGEVIFDTPTPPSPPDFNGTDTEPATGELVAETDGRNWKPTHRWSPLESAPFDPVGDTRGSGHPWHHVYVVDPNPGIAPGDHRKNQLLRNRERANFKPLVQSGTYSLHLARRRPGGLNTSPLIVEVAVMCGKYPHPKGQGYPPMVRKLQKFEVAVGALEYLDESFYDSENKRMQATFTQRIQINPIARTIENAGAEEIVLDIENPSEYTRHLTYTV
jgi:hypothetical protein